jgi:hypothetical protein
LAQRSENFRRDGFRPGVDKGLSADKPGESHHVLDIDDVNPDENALADRLRRTRDLLDTQSVMNKLLQNKKLLNQLKEEFGEDFLKKAPSSLGPELLNNPDLRRKLEKAIEGQHFSPDDLKKLKSLAESKLGPKTSWPSENTRPTPPGTEPAPPPPLQGGPMPPPGRHTQGFVPLGMNQPDNPTLKEKILKELGHLADRLEDLDDDDSAGLRDALRSFSRGGLNLDSLDSLEDSFSYLPRFSDVLEGADLGSIRMPSLGRWHWPSFRSLNFSLGGSPGAPTFSPSSGSLGGTGTVFLWIGIVVLLLLLAWKGPGWYRRSGNAQADSPWRLGAWPVQPGQVTTRRDLIRAFEYLALLILGPAASTCHHRDLAARLGGPDEAASDSAPRRQAAEQLARLYEQVRYVPGMTVPEEPLPPKEQTAARQALSLLAGVAPA